MGAAALLSNVTDVEVFDLLFPWREQFPALAAAVRADHLGIFADPVGNWLGRDIPVPISNPDYVQRGDRRFLSNSPLDI